MGRTLREINRYPVKSCRGQSLDAITVEAPGLAGDRRWMVVHADGAQITAREYPHLLQVEPTLRPDGGLDLVAPGRADLAVEVPPADRLVPVGVWRHKLEAALADDAASDWFSDLLGVAARLVFHDDPSRRRPNPRFGQPDDEMSLADGYPILVTTTASLDAVNDAIAAGPLSDEGPLPMVRFRPNLVVDGASAWEEDGWRRVRIGEARFRAVKGCDRCVMTTVDPATAAKGKEPIATLARLRKWDGITWFGMNLITDTPGATIRVGDEVELLESVPAPDGPPR